MVTLADKCRYLSDQLGIDIFQDEGDSVVPSLYTDQVAALNEMVVEAWIQKKTALDSLKFSELGTVRAIEDILEAMRQDGLWSDTDPRFKDIDENGNPKATSSAMDKLSLRRGNRTIVKQAGIALADGTIDSQDAAEITGEQTTFWNTLKGWFT